MQNGNSSSELSPQPVIAQYVASVHYVLAPLLLRCRERGKPQLHLPMESMVYLRSIQIDYVLGWRESGDKMEAMEAFDSLDI